VCGTASRLLHRVGKKAGNESENGAGGTGMVSARLVHARCGEGRIGRGTLFVNRRPWVQVPPPAPPSRGPALWLGPRAFVSVAVATFPDRSPIWRRSICLL
jgi:hypothetical protein